MRAARTGVENDPKILARRAPSGSCVAFYIGQQQTTNSMKRSLIKIAAFGLLAVAIAAAPSRAMAESTGATNSVAAPTKKKRDTAPFHGKVSAIDKTAMTV